MYLLQYRSPGSNEWHTCWADIRSKTIDKTRDYLDKKRRYMIRTDRKIVVGSVFRILGPAGHTTYFHNA